MTATPSIDLTGFLDEQLSQASPDLMRQMLKTFAEALMSADADRVCGAAYGERSQERVNSRNGYRTRQWDTRTGSIDLAIPKLREGSYFPDWLLERRRRAEAAMISVVATSYLLGVSTRRVEKLVATLGITGLSKSLGVPPLGECRRWPPTSTSRSNSSAPGRCATAPTRLWPLTR